MPSARANINAKFIAQIEMSKTDDEQGQAAGRGHQPDDRQHQRQPGGDQRPERQHEDRERDRPADQLRVHHRGVVGRVEVRPHARGPGQVDRHAVAAQGLQRLLEVVGGADHLVGVGLGAAQHDAVRPSAEIVAPGRGGITVATRESARSRASTSARTCCAAGSVTCPGRCARPPSARRCSPRRTRVARARGRPPTPTRWPPSRRRTSTCCALGANAMRAAATTSQATSVTRKWVAAQAPRRPNGPGCHAGCAGGVGHGDPLSSHRAPQLRWLG